MHRITYKLPYIVTREEAAIIHTRLSCIPDLAAYLGTSTGGSIELIIDLPQPDLERAFELGMLVHKLISDLIDKRYR